MARYSRVTTLEQRVEIGERANRGQNDSMIAREMDLSPWVVRKWRRTWQHAGRGGLASHRGRPATGRLSQTPAEVREALLKMRQAHPGWGPLTLCLELEEDERFKGREMIPGCSGAAAFLQENQLTQKYGRRTELPQPSVGVPQEPHEEWELDAQGVMRVTPAGKVSLINICDVFSTLKIDSYPCLHKSKPSTLDYQLVLRPDHLRIHLPLGRCATFNSRTRTRSDTPRPVGRTRPPGRTPSLPTSPAVLAGGVATNAVMCCHARYELIGQCPVRI